MSVSTIWPIQLVIVSFLTLISARYLTDDLSVLLLFGLTCLAFSATPAKTSKTSRARMSFDFHLLFLAALLCSSLMAWIVAGWDTKTLLTKQVIPYVLILGSIVILVLRLQTLDRHQTSKCLMAVFDGMALYAIANVLAYFILGLRSPAEAFRLADASALSWFDSRITFPLSNGLSIPPAIAASYAVAYGFIRSSGDPNAATQWFRFAGFLACVLILLAAGVRIPLLAAIFVFAGMRLLPRLTSRSTAFIATGLLLLPLWWSVSSGVLAEPGESITKAIPIFSSEKRATVDRQYIASLSSRTDIWDTVLQSAQTMSAPDLLFGYGAIGQIPSGISHETAYLFGFIENPEVASAHNSFLQQFVDQGAIGATLLILSVIVTGFACWRLYRKALLKEERLAALSVTGVIIVLAVSGSTEQVLSSGTPSEPFWLFLLLTILVREISVRQDEEEAVPMVTPAAPQALHRPSLRLRQEAQQGVQRDFA